MWECRCVYPRVCDFLCVPTSIHLSVDATTLMGPVLGQILDGGWKTRSLLHHTQSGERWMGHKESPPEKHSPV